jgi:hypothetical protein
MGKRECVLSGEKRERFMVAYIPWTRLANFITGEKKHRTDVQTRFLKRPNGTGPPKELRHNTGLYNYKYTNVTDFLCKLCCLLEYRCLVRMLSRRMMQTVAMMPCQCVLHCT